MKNTIKAIKKAFIVVLIAQLAVIAISCKGGSGNGKVSKEAIVAVIDDTMKYQKIRATEVVADYWRAREEAADYAETAKYSLEKDISKEQMKTMLDTLNMNLAKVEKEYDKFNDSIKKMIRPDLFENNEN